MKDEIKEILDYIDDRIIPNEKWNKIKDCITNLQEENDYLKDIVSNTELSDEIKKADKWSKRELYKINYQRLQVNKRLKEENEKLMCENINLKDNLEVIDKSACFWEDTSDNYKTRMNIYKSRNEKAIEELKSSILDCNYSKENEFYESIINILEGSDK